jgi:stage IV sporulation protein FB
MRELSSWSLNLGRWGGVHVRLHALFLAAALFVVALGVRSGVPLGYTLLGLGILFVSVLLHELGHCFAAFRLGGGADQIVLWPWGGLAPARVPHEPQCELRTALAGPLVNFVIWLTVIPALLFRETDLLALLRNPLHPHGLIDGVPWMVVLKMTCWVNWLLVVINLLPAPPFDGGRAMRAILWPAFGYRMAGLAVSRIARFTALGLCLLAWLMDDMWSDSLMPAWLPLGLLAIFVFFYARQESERIDDHESDEELFGYDFSQGYTSLERPHDSPKGSKLAAWRRWLENRRRLREEREAQQEAEEERRVDDILARLHASGMHSLSPAERALLHRVSARYRNRQQSS